MNPDYSSAGNQATQGLLSLLSSQNPSQPPPTPQPTPPPVAGNNQNFFQRALPTIGSIVGGIGGGLLGGAIDVGTLGAAAPLINPFTLGVAGAGLGGGAGKAIEDISSGQKIGGDVLGAAGQGAVGQAVGGGIGALGGQILGKVGAGVTESAAPKLFSQAFNLTKSAASRLNPAEVSSQLMDYGIKGGLGSMQATAKAAMTPIEKTIQDAAAQAGPVSTKNLIGDVRNLIATSPELTAKDANDILRTVVNVRSPQLSGLAGGDINRLVDVMPSTMNPIDALSGARNLETQGYNYLNAANPANPNFLRFKQLGNTYLGAAKSIMDELENSVGSSVDISALKTPDVIQALSNISPKLAQQFQSASSLGDLRSLMSPFYRLNKMVDMTNASQASGVSTRLGSLLQGAAGGFGLGGVKGALGGMALSPIIQGGEAAFRAPLSTFGAGAADVAGNVLSKLGTAAPTAGGILGTTTATSPNLVTPMTGANMNPMAIPSQTPQVPQAPAQGASNPNLLNDLLTLAVYSPGSLSSLMPSATQQEQSALATKAQSALGGLSSTFQQAGGGQGMIGGLLSQLGGAISGGTPRAYQQQVKAVAQQIAQVTGEDAGAVERELPTQTDTPQAAQLKLQKVAASLQAAQAAPLRTGLAGLFNAPSPSLLGSL